MRVFPLFWSSSYDYTDFIRHDNRVAAETTSVKTAAAETAAAETAAAETAAAETAAAETAAAETAADTGPEIVPFPGEMLEPELHLPS